MPSQKIGLSKSAGLDVELGGAIGEVSRASVRIRKGSLTEPRASVRPIITL